MNKGGKKQEKGLGKIGKGINREKVTERRGKKVKCGRREKKRKQV